MNRPWFILFFLFHFMPVFLSFSFEVPCFLFLFYFLKDGLFDRLIVLLYVID